MPENYDKQSSVDYELRRLKIRSHRLASIEFVGNFRSAFRGSGLTFAELQEYQPGDDVRLIDWKASARHNKAFVRSYEEERQLSIVVVLDTSRSLYFGSFAGAQIGQRATKFTRALELVSLIAQVAKLSGDAFGLMTFSRHIENWISPKAKQKQTERVILELLEKKEPSRSTHIREALQELNIRLRKHSVVFIVSDFFGEDISENIAQLSSRHDVVCCLVEDQLDQDIPPIGFVYFADAEGSDQTLVDLGSKHVRNALLDKLKLRKEQLLSNFSQNGAEFFSLEKNPFQDLNKFLELRNAKLSKQSRRKGKR